MKGLINGKSLDDDDDDEGISTMKINRRFEIPLPFGYHMDLDFLRFCSQELVNGETLDRLKDLRRTRRKQRKTLEALIGIKQEQRDREKRLIRDFNNDYNDDDDQALKVAVHDFEQCFEKTKDNFVCSTPLSTKKKPKFGTFPRTLTESTETEKLFRQSSSNSSISSSSATAYSPDAVAANDRTETESIVSISSEMSTTTLRNIREQMAKSLAKLKDYEKQVETIPLMQVKLSVLKEEKRLLMLQLKQKELEMTRKGGGMDDEDDDVELFDSEDDDDDDDDDEVDIKNATRRTSYYHFVDPSRPRARSESPFTKNYTEDLRRRKRSNSCGYKSDDSSSDSSMRRRHRQQQQHRLERSQLNFSFSKRRGVKDGSSNTETVRTRDHSTATPEIRTGTKSVSAVPIMRHKSTKTNVSMTELITKDEAEKRVQEAIFKTEEELMGCPLLQKAMAKVEEEALRGGPFEKVDSSCQVGDENLRPFVIEVGLQTSIEAPRPITYDYGCQTSPDQRDFECQSYDVIMPSSSPVSDPSPRKVSIGVGDEPVTVQVDENRIKYRDIGVCTEKWVEVIMASKQTDTEDFAFKDTESPRVADLFDIHPIPSPTSLSRKSSFQSPLSSRRSSVVRKTSRSTMTASTSTVGTKTVSTNTEEREMKSVGTDGPSTITTTTTTTNNNNNNNNNLCDKCYDHHRDVKQPPSPDMPWLSKIPRPIIPENPDVFKLKSASSTSNLFDRPRSPWMVQRSKSSLTSSSLISRRQSPTHRDLGTPPPHPQSPTSMTPPPAPPVTTSSSPASRRIPSPLTRSYSPSTRSFIPKLTQKKATDNSSTTITTSINTTTTTTATTTAVAKSLIPRVVTPPALRKMYPSDKLTATDRNVVRKNTYTKKEMAGVVTHDVFTPIDENRSKAEPSTEMKAALKVLNDSLMRHQSSSSSRINAQVNNAINIVQQEWFKTSSTKQSNPLDVEDYLDVAEDISKPLLNCIVNLTDVNGNTALHYSVSHGNFDVVSVLLDSKVADPNILNKAGYTCIMLISLAQITNSVHRAVVERLFSLGDINIRASQHGQTALMLAVSHGRLDMVQLLVEAGGDINVRDEDGSTALMCAAEHGHMEIVKYLIAQGDTNLKAKDNDGLTALDVAMEAGHRDVGVILYTAMSLSNSRGASPYSKDGKASASPSQSNTPIPPDRKSRRNSTNQ